MTSSSSGEFCQNFLYIIDRFYRVEAFDGDQVLRLLNWRRRLTQLSKNSIKNEHKPTPLVPSHSFQSRRSFKSSPKSTKNSYPVSLTKFNSEPQHNNTLFDSVSHRRSIKSPSVIHPTHEEPTNYSIITKESYLANHQHQTLTRKKLTRTAKIIHRHGQNSVKHKAIRIECVQCRIRINNRNQH